MKLEELNSLDREAAREALTKCCGAGKWANGMLQGRSFVSEEALFVEAERVWFEECSETDWLEAFTHHPKIGNIDSLRKKFAATADWAGNEQSGVDSASEAILSRLAEGNEIYESRFGYIFIVCATGKSATEMLELLEDRLNNDPEKEIRIAMGEQNKITHIRLEKLLT